VERPARKLIKALSDPLVYAGLVGIDKTANALGPRAGYRVASVAGWLWYHLFRKRQRIIHRNLDIAFPGRLDREAKHRIGLACCRHALANVIDNFVRDRLIDESNWRDYGAMDPVLESVLFAEQPTGLAVLSAHLGSWEMGLYFCGLLGKPLSPIVRDLDNPYMNRHSAHLRSRFGETLISKSGALRGILRELKSGGRVAIMADQSAPMAEGFQPFFGVPASTYSSYARVLIRRNCRVVFSVCVRDGFHFRFRSYSRVLDVPHGGSETERAAGLLASYLRALEDAIRAHPEQYVWMHRRYKLSPDHRPSIYDAPWQRRGP
jgi:KDO2-lipid IV(A) lauroyltransferase